MQGYMTCKLMNCVFVQDSFTENGILTTTLKAYNPIFFVNIHYSMKIKSFQLKELKAFLTKRIKSILYT